MIRRIKIRNFQAHECFDLDLDSNVTVLVGESDQGKSACLRALRWACCNSIRGDDFITHGEETCKVIVELDEAKITRQTGKGGNFYQIDKGKHYKSFRNDVPEEIARLLNVDDSLNFQGQLDAPFWLSLSSGEVSRELNRIVNLERIDAVLSRCAGEIRKTKAALQVSEERLETAKQDRDRLAWVVEAHKEYERIVSVQEDIASETHRIDALSEAIDEASKLQFHVQVQAEAKADAVKVMREMEKIADLAERVAELTEAIGEAKESWQRCESLKSERIAAQQSLEDDSKGKCPVCGNALS